MKEGVLQFTLRRLQAVVFAPRFWAVMLIAAVMLGVAGPFGTMDRMPLLPRLAYWLAIALTTFLAGYLAIGLMVHTLLGDVGTRPVRLAIAGFAAGVPVTAIVLTFNHFLFGDPVGSTAEILGFYIDCSLISAALSLLFGLVDMRTEAVDPEQPEVPGETTLSGLAPAAERPAILERLPAHLRGRLLYMSMQDHYVDVHTDRGGALVLMRLADAISEARGTDGLQVHRSHWVARDAVAGTERKDGRLSLRLSDGNLVPVSRTYLSAVREAGLA